MATISLEGVVRGYIAAALWSTNDNSDPETGGDPLDANYNRDDIAPAALERMVDDCRKFLAKHGGDLARNPCSAEQAGHDLWLTRNGHGAGFWDRDDDTYAGPTRDALDAYAQSIGECDIYVGDDGKLYV